MNAIDLEQEYGAARGQRGALDDGEREIRETSQVRLAKLQERVLEVISQALALPGFQETVQTGATLPVWDADGGICTVFSHAHGRRLAISAEVDLSQVHGDGVSFGIAGSSPVRLSVTDRETITAEKGSLAPAFDPSSLIWSIDRDDVAQEFLRLVRRLASDLSADGAPADTMQTA